MNPTVKFFTVLFIALEVSFTHNLYLNLLLILGSLIYLLFNHTKLKTLFYLLIIPFIPALGIFISQTLYGVANTNEPLVLATRIYVFVWVGACFSKTTTIEELAMSLEQNCHLPSQFAYGVLSAFNSIAKIKTEISEIKVASQMRGINLHFWSPTLYFKAILSAIRWSTDMSEAMTSHGFIENAPRTHRYQIKIRKKDISVAILLLIVIQIPIIL